MTQQFIIILVLLLIVCFCKKMKENYENKVECQTSLSNLDIPISDWKAKSHYKDCECSEGSKLEKHHSHPLYRCFNSEEFTKRSNEIKCPTYAPWDSQHDKCTCEGEYQYLNTKWDCVEEPPNWILDVDQELCSNNNNYDPLLSANDKANILACNFNPDSPWYIFEDYSNNECLYKNQNTNECTQNIPQEGVNSIVYAFENGCGHGTRYNEKAKNCININEW